MPLPADSFDSLLERLIAQLDSLVPFLALSHREVFDVLKEKYPGWYEHDRQSTLPSTFEGYVHQVAHAAFLLGYSYAEAFVTDLIFDVYNARRDKLPSDKKLCFEDVLQSGDFEGVMRHMIESTIGEMNSLEAKLRHLEVAFGWRFPETEKLGGAHVARHALVHNAGVVNREQLTGSRWQSGDTIQLSSVDVHDFGFAARALASKLAASATAFCQPSRRRT
jgi:hypothetical protein